MYSSYVTFYYALSAVLIALMLYQGLKRQVDLLSHRNLYLAGFIFFQLIGAAVAIQADDYKPVTLLNVRSTLSTYFLYVVVFLICYFLSYHKNPLSGWIASRFRPRQAYVANDWLLLMVALVFVALGVFLRFAAWQYGPIAYLSGFVPAFPAACAIVAWVWGGRRFNLAVVSIGSLVFAVSLLVTVWGVWGRRPLVGVCLATAWGAFHRMQAKLSMGKVLLWATPILLISAHLIGAMSTYRGADEFGLTTRDKVAKMLTTSPADSFRGYLINLNDAKFTLWAIDAYPDRIEQRHLFSFYYMVIHPIPRAIWEDKPSPLSVDVSELAGIKGVNHAVLTIPPGVLGYADAEGGWYALILYGLFFGMFTRFFDEIVRQNRGDPFLVLTVGCTLGQVLGMARGDIALFANLTTLGFLSVWAIMWVSRYVIGRRMPYSTHPMPQVPLARPLR